MHFRLSAEFAAERFESPMAPTARPEEFRALGLSAPLSSLERDLLSPNKDIADFNMKILAKLQFSTIRLDNYILNI